MSEHKTAALRLLRSMTDQDEQVAAMLAAEFCDVMTKHQEIAKRGSLISAAITFAAAVISESLAGPTEINRVVNCVLTFLPAIVAENAATLGSVSGK